MTTMYLDLMIRAVFAIVLLLQMTWIGKSRRVFCLRLVVVVGGLVADSPSLQHYGWTLRQAMVLGVLSLLLVAAVEDMLERRVRLRTSLGCWLVSVLPLYYGLLRGPEVTFGALSGLAGFVPFLVTGGLGGADLLLAPVLGLWFGLYGVAVSAAVVLAGLAGMRFSPGFMMRAGLVRGEPLSLPGVACLALGALVLACVHFQRFAEWGSSW